MKNPLFYLSPKQIFNSALKLFTFFALVSKSDNKKADSDIYNSLKKDGRIKTNIKDKDINPHILRGLEVIANKNDLASHVINNEDTKIEINENRNEFFRFRLDNSIVISNKDYKVENHGDVNFSTKMIYHELIHAFDFLSSGKKSVNPLKDKFFDNNQNLRKNYATQLNQCFNKITNSKCPEDILVAIKRGNNAIHYIYSSQMQSMLKNISDDNSVVQTKIYDDFVVITKNDIEKIGNLYFWKTKNAHFICNTQSRRIMENYKMSISEDTVLNNKGINKNDLEWAEKHTYTVSTYDSKVIEILCPELLELDRKRLQYHKKQISNKPNNNVVDPKNSKLANNERVKYGDL